MLVLLHSTSNASPDALRQDASARAPVLLRHATPERRTGQTTVEQSVEQHLAMSKQFINHDN